MALHLLGVHTSYAVVRTVATGMIVRILLYMIDKIGVFDQHVCQLEQFEAFVHDLLTVIARLHTAYINQCGALGVIGELRVVVESLQETLGLLHKIQLTERNRRRHYIAYEWDIQSRLQPPHGLHRHVVCQGLDGHGTAQDGHGRTAHGSTGKHDAVHMVLGNFLGHTNTFIDIGAVPAVVPHIGLNNHRHIILGVQHDFVQYLVEEAYAVLKRTAILIVTMIGAGRDELRNKVSMTGMNLHAVKTGLATEVHSLTEFPNHLLDLTHLQAAMDGRAVQVKAIGGADGHTMAGREVRHIAAVTELDAGFSTLCVDGIGQFAKSRQSLRTNIELSVKANATQIHSTVRHRGHSHAAVGHADVVVMQHLARGVTRAHILKRCRTDKTISQRDRPQLEGGK